MDDKLHQDSLAEASTSAGLPPSDLSLSLSLSPAASTLVTYRRWTVPERIKLESLVESYGGEAVDWSAVAVAVVAAFPATELGANRTGAECEKKWRTLLAARTSLPSHPRRLPPTPLQPPAKVPANTKSPAVKWNPGQVDLLLSAADRRPDGGALSIAEFTELGQSMTPKRTWQSCKQKWYAMYLHKRPRGNGFGSTGDQDGLSKLPAAPTSGGSHALSLSPPSSTVVNRGDDRFTPYSYTPRPEVTETLVSVDEQPFGPADDNAMLEMNARWPTGAYKRIARSLEPPRHKGEVRERLRELLSATDVVSGRFTPSTNNDDLPASPASNTRSVVTFESPIPFAQSEFVGGDSFLSPKSSPFFALPMSAGPSTSATASPLHLGPAPVFISPSASSIDDEPADYCTCGRPRPAADGSFESAAEALRRLAVPTQRLW